MGRGCHLCRLCSQLIFIKRSRVYCCKCSYAHQASQKKFVSGLVIQIFSAKVLQKSSTILQLKVYIVYVMQKLIGLPPWQECPINLASFIFPFVCNADLWIISFFITSREISHHKVRKVMDANL